MQQYTETVYRYVVETLESYPAQHRAEMIINGIDPDNNWLLSWSFQDERNAIEQMNRDQERHQQFCESRGYTPTKKWRVRDNGQQVEIKRSVFF